MNLASVAIYDQPTWYCDSLAFGTDENVNVEQIDGMVRNITIDPPSRRIMIIVRLLKIDKADPSIDLCTQN